MYDRLRKYAIFLSVLSVAAASSPSDDGAASAGISGTLISTPITSVSTLRSGTATTKESGDATCPSRTVNYITHTLPQQCLRTGRVTVNSTQSDSVTISATATTTDNEAVRLPVGVDATSEKNPPQVETPSDGPGTSTVQIEEATSAVTTHGPPSSASADVPSDGSGVVVTVAEQEPDSALDNANFLSFEEWKKANLEKIGQSPENIGRGQASNVNRQRPDINNALDTLGEDSEIDLDFSGFGGDNKPAAKPKSGDDRKQASSDRASVDQQSPASPVLRSKDAGKTCKERTNYASFDCAATVMKSNKECKSASSILIENKDSYMLNTCSAQNKFFIVELCNDILIDTVVLANYEFFSSGFRQFRLSVSDRYPVKLEKWKNLGTFEARNTREIQAFLVENPLIWARYLRIELLTHYGSEYYCPVSLLRVHGTTMLEEFRHQEELARGEVEDTDLEVEVEISSTPVVAQEPAQSSAEEPDATLQASPSVPDAPTAEEQPNTETNLTEVMDSTGSKFNGSANEVGMTSPSLSLADFLQDIGLYEPTGLKMTCAVPTVSPSALGGRASNNSTSQQVAETAEAPGSNSSSLSKSIHGLNTTFQAISSTSLSPNGTISVQSQVTSSNTTADATVTNTVPISNSTVSATPSSNSSRVVSSSSSTPPQATVQPPTQESFFKSVSKRLQQLESNSTLSLQYIEEQSRILRDAFSKVEKRQIATTTTFLSNLNETVMAELRGFRQAYDQLWQSTVIELEGQREQYQREMLLLSSRLTLVADELLWQKRMGIVQSTILLLSLALVLFSRSNNGYLEVPLMQQMMNRSSAALRASWDSPPNSASPESRSPVSLFRRKLWRSSQAEPNGSGRNSHARGAGSKDGPEVMLSPPTPSTSAPQSEDEGEKGDEDGLDGLVMAERIGRMQEEPPEVDTPPRPPEDDGIPVSMSPAVQ